MCSMTSSGHPYARFKRVLATGNLALIRAAAAELPHVSLDDALVVCVAIRDAEPARFERAALRWLARFALERAATVAAVREAAAAFETMAAAPEQALTRLQRLCS
jgi:hypothetical protein